MIRKGGRTKQKGVVEKKERGKKRGKKKKEKIFNRNGIDLVPVSAMQVMQRAKRRGMFQRVRRRVCGLKQAI